MTWRDAIIAYAERREREAHRSPLGVGVEFGDGCAAFWALPNEATSTVTVPPEGPDDVDTLLAQYEVLDHRRERVLHVIRHLLADKRIRTNRSRSGVWATEGPSGWSLQIDIGDILTRYATEHEDIHDLVHACLQGAYLGGKPPSRKRVERYLSIEGPPTDEPQWNNDATREEDEGDDDDEPATIAAAVASINACHAMGTALDALGEGADAEEAKRQATAAPEGLFGRVHACMLRLAERLPDVTAHHEMFGSKLTIDFSDGFGAFIVNPRDRKLLRRIQKEEPATVGDTLAEEFIRLDDARRRVFVALFRAANERGWKLDHNRGLRLLGVPEMLSLGAETREVTLEPGEPLTHLLREASPENALRTLLSTAPDFAAACVEALHWVDEGERPVRPPEALLPEALPTDGPRLVELTDERIAALDRFARARTKRLLSDTKSLWKYLDANVYIRGGDGWATPEKWAQLAERSLAEHGLTALQVIIFREAGRPDADDRAREWFAQSEPHHEVSDAEVELAWAFRHTAPPKAREWFAPQMHESIPFAEVRARLGDPIAIRQRAMAAAESADDDDDRDPRHLPPEEREAMHRRLLEWARTTSRCSPPDAGELKRAIPVGWRDVAEAFGTNPHLLPGLLTSTRRADQFDEPGALLASDFFLAWSRLDPSLFLARLIATVHETDLVELASQAARNVAELKPETAGAVDASISIYHAWLDQLNDALAIAWLRCRANRSPR